MKSIGAHGMYLLYADEAGVEASQGQFFIYGGLVIAAERAGDLDAAVRAALLDQRYTPFLEGREPRPLKFRPKVLPEGVTNESLRRLKQAVLKAAAEHKTRLLAVLASHEVIRREDLRHFGINTLLRSFCGLLKQEKRKGLVFIDTYGTKDESRPLRGIMTERFLAGLWFPKTSTREPLTGVLGLAETCIGASHFSSVVDVALGSLRHAVNEREGPQKMRTAKDLLKQVAPFVNVFLAPKSVEPHLREPYVALARFLGENGIAARVPSVRGR